MASTTDRESLADRSWPSVAEIAAIRTLLVPVGSTEQHGPHLPLDTDTRIADAIAHGVAASTPERILVAPPVAYGASGEHADFPGTLSIGVDALATMLVELGRSADAFGQVVFVNGHGGNLGSIASATSTLQREGRAVRSWSWTVLDGDAHAGRTETSMVLAIAPETVHLDAAEAGRVEPVGDLLDALRRDGVRAVSPNGVLGDPSGASAEEGRAILARQVEELRGFLDDG
jgi:creatinine amidohydrolase